MSHVKVVTYVVMLDSRVAAVEKAEAEKVQVVKAAEADAEVSLQTIHHPNNVVL